MCLTHSMFVDLQLLSEIMLELGAKHIRYGVKADMFPVMGDSLLLALGSVLKDDFTDEIREAWVETYAELSGDMIKGQVRARRS